MRSDSIFRVDNMSPVRLLILAVLFYIGYRLIVSGLKKKFSSKDGVLDSSGDSPVSDVLVEDPVCHTLVPKKQAVHLQYDEAMVYFCSEKCCDTFVKEHGE